MEQKICIRCCISGHVQGVWFRASTQEQAKALDVVGWVRNLSGGGVEVLACGERESVLKLYEWLKTGPDLAKVEEVTYEELPLQQHQRFAIKE